MVLFSYEYLLQRGKSLKDQKLRHHVSLRLSIIKEGGSKR